MTIEGTLLGFSASKSPVKTVRAKVGEKPPIIINGGVNQGGGGLPGSQGGDGQGGAGS